jgi:hypothetical protein
MAATPPSKPNPSGDDRNLVPVDENYAALTFEDKLNLFWKKNRNVVLGLCAAVLLAIIGKGIWDRVAHQKEVEIEQAYAVATTPDQLRGFIAAHPDHSLAGVAQLRLADEAYLAGKSADALAGYDKAVALIKTGPLEARAQLGRALAKLQAGKTAEGTADLKQLAADTNQFKAIRAQAGYQLASLAADRGDAAEVQKYSDQVMQIDPDPSSPWARMAMMLRTSLPTPPAAPATPAAAPTPKKDDAAPKVEIKLPAK